MKFNVLVGFASFMAVQGALISPMILKEALQENALVTRDAYQVEVDEELATRQIDITPRFNETKRSDETLTKRSNETELDKRSFNATKRADVPVEKREEDIMMIAKRDNDTDTLIKKRFANPEAALRRAQLNND